MAHILIVDDDPAMLSFLSKALENAGHKITSDKNGLDALKTLQENSSFDLLLTDVVMPGMDGMELSTAAEKLYPALKIMFITGFAASALNKAKGPNINGRVIAKPFHLKDLIARVEALLAE